MPNLLPPFSMHRLIMSLYRGSNTWRGHGIPGRAWVHTNIGRGSEAQVPTLQVNKKHLSNKHQQHYETCTWLPVWTAAMGTKMLYKTHIYMYYITKKNTILTEGKQPYKFKFPI